MQLSIDAEFKQLIPALSEEEYQQLEQNIITEGCRDALVVWQDHNTLIDGHNRYEICTRHNLPYRTIERAFDSREDVIVWIIQNQFGRRNLTPFVRSELALKMEEAVAAKAKANQQAAGGDRRSEDAKNAFDQLVKSEPIHTRKELAKAADVGQGTMQRTQAIITFAPEPIKAKARSGDLSVNRAYHLTQALKQSPAEHQARIMELCEDNDEKVHILNRLYKSMGSEETNGTFEEIMRTGGFHYGADMRNWCNFALANVEAIQRALKSVADYHRVIEAQSEEPTPLPPIPFIPETMPAPEPEPEKPATTMAVHYSSDTPEWYTPPEIIERVVKVMGAVDLDPCSNDKNAPNVPAGEVYTKADDGLAQYWHGRVYMNPPYGNEIKEWVDKVIHEYESGQVTQALLLLPSRTDTQWFRALRKYPRCFIHGRLRFSGHDNSAPFPNMIVSLGCDQQTFIDVFSDIGDVYELAVAS